MLFDGKDLSAWENGENWKVEDGIATIGRGPIQTKQSFGDCQMHIEWSAPVPATGESQGRSNSGIYFMGLYEVQILDSYQNKTYFDGQAGAIYKQTPPMANAMRPPGDAFFHFPTHARPRKRWSTLRRDRAVRRQGPLRLGERRELEQQIKVLQEYVPHNGGFSDDRGN